MSSFSSIVHKPGKKITPRAAPRRNVPPRKSVSAGVRELTNLQNDRHNLEESAILVNDSPQLPPQDSSESSLQEPPSAPRPISPITRRKAASVSQDASVDLVTEPDSQNSTVVTARSASQIRSDGPQHRTRSKHNDSAIDQSSLNINGSHGQTDTRSTDDDLGGVPSPQTEMSLEGDSESHIDDTEVTHPTRQRNTTSISQRTTSPRKRRKTTPRAAPELALSQSISTLPPSPRTSLRVRPLRRDSNHSHQSDDLLQSATRQAATVSELANTIESQTRALRPQTEENPDHESEPDVGNDTASSSTLPASQSKTSRRKRTLQEQAAEVVANVVGKYSESTRQRNVTPEHAQDYELEPAKVTMGELCEDNKLGKKSTLETEMQANWPEIVQRRREDRERALINAEKRRRKGIGQKSHLLTSSEPVVALAPAMAVVNGVIVVDQASREIDRSAQLQQTAVQDLQNVREDRDYYKYVNQATVGIKPGHTQHAKWDEESTELFFKGLRMFGTDFLMIANMFPGMTRKQIKNKFIREENADKSRVLNCLQNQEFVQLEDYAQMANRDTDGFHTLESIQKELDDQEKRLRDEDNQRRKREGFITAENGDRAQTGDLGDNDVTERQTESAEPGRFDAIASQIVEAAVGPRKRQRKSTTANSRRGPKGGRRPEGGVEEILGSITEVAV